MRLRIVIVVKAESGCWEEAAKGAVSVGAHTIEGPAVALKSPGDDGSGRVLFPDSEEGLFVPQWIVSASHVNSIGRPIIDSEAGKVSIRCEIHSSHADTTQRNAAGTGGVM
jgi:hypothetical protein